MKSDDKEAAPKINEENRRNEGKQSRKSLFNRTSTEEILCPFGSAQGRNQDSYLGDQSLKPKKNL